MSMSAVMNAGMPHVNTGHLKAPLLTPPCLPATIYMDPVRYTDVFHHPYSALAAVTSISAAMYTHTLNGNSGDPPGLGSKSK